jgi:hypothetical protein
VQRDDFTPFFEKLIDADFSFYDSDIELTKVDRGIDELRTINAPVLGFVFGY